jgi:hypothetical protein
MGLVAWPFKLPEKGRGMLDGLTKWDSVGQLSSVVAAKKKKHLTKIVSKPCNTAIGCLVSPEPCFIGLAQIIATGAFSVWSSPTVHHGGKSG